MIVVFIDLFVISTFFLFQIFVLIVIGSVVDSGSEGMTLPWKGRSFGHQTTVLWDLLTGRRVNQINTMRIVYQFVATNFGTTIIVIIITHTSVKPLQCKQ